VLFDKSLIDPLPADVIQQIFKGSDVFNMGFQTVQHALNQFIFLYHGSVAIVFLARGTEVIKVFFPFIGNGFACHTVSAAATNQNTGKQIYPALARSSSRIQIHNPLHKVKIVFSGQNGEAANGIRGCLSAKNVVLFTNG